MHGDQWAFGPGPRDQAAVTPVPGDQRLLVPVCRINVLKTGFAGSSSRKPLKSAQRHLPKSSDARKARLRGSTRAEARLLSPTTALVALDL